MASTSNIGLQVPAIGSNNWGGPLNYNFSQLDLWLSGLAAIPGLLVSGNVVVQGSITAGSFVGLSGGTFLTSSQFNQPNGVPQLDSNGKIPASLFTGSGLVVVASSPTPVFNAVNGNSFKNVLTANATATYNGATGATLVAFRFVQDGTGGRVLTWPANVRNGGAVNPDPGGRSLQLFSQDADLSLDAITPMMYS